MECNKGGRYFQELCINKLIKVKSKLDRLEMIHLLIFQSIIINQDFEDNFDTEWIEIYNDLKEYLFASLCQKEYTNISLDIFKKFFSFDKILSKLLEVINSRNRIPLRSS